MSKLGNAPSKTGEPSGGKRGNNPPNAPRKTGEPPGGGRDKNAPKK